MKIKTEIYHIKLLTIGVLIQIPKWSDNRVIYQMFLTVEFCAMGMKSRDIADADISTSSDWESFHHGQYGRLDEQPASNPTSYGAWISRKREFFQSIE